jgi:hypothetical protein
MSEENNEGAKKTFQVVDRRRFDSEGRERQHEGVEEVTVGNGAGTSPASSSSSSEQPRTAAPSGASETAGPGGAALQGDQAIAQQFRMESGESEESGVSFMSFLMSLATQALVQIGEMDPPEGMEIPVDVEAGRQTIEILAMLQRKTRGNLSSEEGRFLEEVLHTLRMSYVRRAR